MNSESLAGLIVLVTRPLPQQKTYVDAIEACAGKAISLPLIEINPLTDLAEIDLVKSKIQNLDSFDILIFVSINAVTHGAITKILCRYETSVHNDMCSMGT